MPKELKFEEAGRRFGLVRETRREIADKFLDYFDTLIDGKKINKEKLDELVNARFKFHTFQGKAAENGAAFSTQGMFTLWRGDELQTMRLSAHEFIHDIREAISKQNNVTFEEESATDALAYLWMTRLLHSPPIKMKEDPVFEEFDSILAEAYKSGKEVTGPHYPYLEAAPGYFYGRLLFNLLKKVEQKNEQRCKELEWKLLNAGDTTNYQHAVEEIKRAVGQEAYEKEWDETLSGVLDGVKNIERLVLTAIPLAHFPEAITKKLIQEINEGKEVGGRYSTINLQKKIGEYLVNALTLDIQKEQPKDLKELDALVVKKVMNMGITNDKLITSIKPKTLKDFKDSIIYNELRLDNKFDDIAKQKNVPVSLVTEIITDWRKEKKVKR